MIEVKTDKVFTPVTIKLNIKQELEELVGALHKTNGSPALDDLYIKLKKELGYPMLGLFSGQIDLNEP